MNRAVWQVSGGSASRSHAEEFEGGFKGVPIDSLRAVLLEIGDKQPDIKANETAS